MSDYSLHTYEKEITVIRNSIVISYKNNVILTKKMDIKVKFKRFFNNFALHY